MNWFNITTFSLFSMQTKTKPFTRPGSGKTSSKTYVLITAFMALFALVGFAYYGLPFFFDFMVNDFGYSRAEVTSGNAVGKLVVAPLFGFLAGSLIDRYGPRRWMMLGAVLMGIAFVGLSHSGSLWMFYLFYVFNALGYLFGGPLPCQVLISRWFDKNRGKAMGIAYLGIGTGGALVPIIATNLEKTVGWQHALSMIGVLIVIIALPLAFFIKDSSGKRIRTANKENPVPMKQILRNPNFHLLAVGSMCSIGAVGGVGQHLKLHLSDLDFTQVQAARIFSLVLISSLVGRVMMGWLSDIIHRKYVMILIYAIVAIAILTLLIPPFPGRIYLFAVVFGIGLGGDYMIIPLMAGDLFGVRALGRTMGIILVADGIAESSLPVLVGYLYNDTVKYTVGFSVLLVIVLIGTICISFLPRNLKNA